MSAEDDYETFLETWEPSERLRHASLPQHLDDPVVVRELLADEGDGKVERTPYAAGMKLITSEEGRDRRYDFFVDRQPKWADQFEDYVLSKGVPRAKLVTFVDRMARIWVDGRARQESKEMLAIKASIQALDEALHRNAAGRFVLNAVPRGAKPLFTVDEMQVIFDANSGLIVALLPDYVDALGADGPGSVGSLHVHRGVRMPSVETDRREVHYLSSFSLALGPVEQFAQTWTPAAKSSGVPSIFSAPLPAIQHRVVAFAPFIAGMSLQQLEFVVAPPIAETILSRDGAVGGINSLASGSATMPPSALTTVSGAS